MAYGCRVGQDVFDVEGLRLIVNSWLSRTSGKYIPHFVKSGDRQSWWQSTYVKIGLYPWSPFFKSKSGGEFYSKFWEDDFRVVSPNQMTNQTHRHRTPFFEGLDPIFHQYYTLADAKTIPWYRAQFSPLYWFLIRGPMSPSVTCGWLRTRIVPHPELKHMEVTL